MTCRGFLALAVSCLLFGWGEAWALGNVSSALEAPARSYSRAGNYSSNNGAPILTLTQPLGLSVSLTGSGAVSLNPGALSAVSLSPSAAQIVELSRQASIVSPAPGLVAVEEGAEERAAQAAARLGPAGETIAGLTRELDRGGSSGQFLALSRFYSQDYALLGPEGDNILARLAREASLAIEGPDRPWHKEAFDEAIAGERKLDWIWGNQAAYPVPVYEWIADRRRRRLIPPQGWFLEHVEARLQRMNEVIRELKGEGYHLPLIFLWRVNILVDDLSDGLRTRASIQKRLKESGYPDIRMTGAFNAFGEKFVTEDFALSPTTHWEDFLAAVAHEFFAERGAGHWNTEYFVRTLMERAFKLDDKMNQRHMEDKVHAALVWGEEQRNRPRVIAVPARRIEPESPYDTLEMPFDQEQLAVHQNPGTTEGDKPMQIPFEHAYLYFDTPQGRVALGIDPVAREPKSEDPGAAEAAKKWEEIIPIERGISLWWEANEDGKSQWRRIFLLTGEEIRNRSIHAPFAKGEERDPGMMLSRGRFQRELLEHFDYAIREFLAEPKHSELARNFVRHVYLSFRHNFSRELGIPLPEFEGSD